MKYYIITGEPSGEMHGANLMKAIKKIDPRAEFRYWGGDKMASQSTEMAMHIRETSFMGFAEVLKNLGKIRQLFKFAKKDISSFKPDAVILIDYPGFNLRMARWLHSKGYRTIYYIVPQVWAWKPGRAYDLQKYCERIITVLPFEPAFFMKKGITVDFAGHPLLDEMDNIPPEATARPNGLSIAVLPGSRKQEVLKMLHPMLLGVSTLKPTMITVVRVKSIPEKLYEDIISRSGVPASSVQIFTGNTASALQHVDGAVVSSGTATLETALQGVPQVVCYKVNPISYWIGKRIVTLDYISLVNLIMDKRVVPELIQDDCIPANIALSLQKVLEDRDTIIVEYALLKEKLGSTGASARAASIIKDTIS